MTDSYKITIRCNHGDRTPRVATAAFDGKVWGISRARPQVKGDPHAGETREEYLSALVVASQTEHSPKTELVSDRLLSSVVQELIPPEWLRDGHPDLLARVNEIQERVRARYVIQCSLCGMRPTMTDVRLFRFLDNQRLADVHTILLSQLVG